MLHITQSIADSIAAIDRMRTDGGLGVVYDGAAYQCRDVRNDPGYADYWPLLADATSAAHCTPLQGLLAIDRAGLSATYEAWAASPERTFAQRAFVDKAQTWRRNDPTLIEAATDIGLSSAQLDDLFALAATF